MINEELLDAIDGFPPHPHIQADRSSTSATPPPSFAALAIGMADPAHVKLEFAGSSSMRPESRSWNKINPTRLLLDGQQDNLEPERSSPRFGLTSKTHFDPTVESNKAKYGDIRKDCVMKAGFMKHMNLFGISCILRVLKKQKIEEFDIGYVKPYYDVVRDAKTVKSDVKWMRQCLEKIREAANSNNEAKLMVVQINECMKRVEQNKEEIKRLQTQFEMAYGMGGIGKHYMINEEQLNAMEGFPPHPHIQSEGSSTSAAPPHSNAVFVVGMADPAPVEMGYTGSSSMRPASRSRKKRKPTRLLPDDQQDDVEPEMSPPQFGSTYKTHFDPTAEAIKANYGDIGKECVMKAGFMQEMNVFGISCMLRVLERQKIDELEIDSLTPYYEVVRDAETLKIDVNWLRQRLDEIREAISSNNAAKLMVVQRNECMKRVEQNKEEMKRLQTQIEMLETQMAVDSCKVKRLNTNINALTAKYQHFQHATLTDGLL